MASTALEDKKVLGRMDLIAIAVGNVIGGGIMSVVGVAIGQTGRSVVLALALCALMTLVMYRKDLSNFLLYRLACGEGEVFHVYEDDAIARARFGFGGTSPRAWSYAVGPDCIGCGLCAAACMMDTIAMSNGKAEIAHFGCNECGICHSICPTGAILSTLVQPVCR